MGKLSWDIHLILKKIYYLTFTQKILKIFLDLFFPLCILKIHKLKEPKIRVGKDNDGGYVIIDGLSYDLLIGCGISNDISFEEEFIELFDVDCYAFDGTINKLPQQNPRIKFIKKNISKRNNKKETNLHELINKANNIFLKMDIEGGEYSWIRSLDYSQLNKLKQIVIEFHAPFLNYRWNCIRKLLKTHYLCHLHANNRCETMSIKNILVPHVFKFTFIRKEDIKYTPFFNNEKIPSRLDMKNDPKKDEIFLEWFPYSDTSK